MAVSLCWSHHESFGPKKCDFSFQVVQHSFKKWASKTLFKVGMWEDLEPKVVGSVVPKLPTMNWTGASAHQFRVEKPGPGTTRWRCKRVVNTLTLQPCWTKVALWPQYKHVGVSDANGSFPEVLRHTLRLLAPSNACWRNPPSSDHNLGLQKIDLPHRQSTLCANLCKLY